MKQELYGKGFRYHFVGIGGGGSGRVGGRVHPENMMNEMVEHPPIMLRSWCGCCGGGGGGGGGGEREGKETTTPADRLAAAIDSAFCNEDGTSKSQVFEMMPVLPM